MKEKSWNIQALVHSTVGQSLPVSVRHWGADLVWCSQAIWNKPPCSSRSPQAPLEKLFPSLISITWPLLFFDYKGSYVKVGRDEKAMFPKKERSPKPPKLMDGESLNICLVFSPPQAGQILDLSGLWRELPRQQGSVLSRNIQEGQDRPPVVAHSLGFGGWVHCWHWSHCHHPKDTETLSFAWYTMLNIIQVLPRWSSPSIVKLQSRSHTDRNHRNAEQFVFTL